MTCFIDHSYVSGNMENSDFPFSLEREATYMGKMDLRIRELRKERGLTQTQLAEKMGITQAHLSDMERGKAEVNTHRLQQFAEHLRVDPYELIPDPKKNKHALLISRLASLSEHDQAIVASLVESLAS